ncbi:unnamed protein product [Sphagnum troendelagicum]|uniref:Uncharacterized protein n=1 Tax=Sphagnum troendelagicum TaxID=128251 RepID=A0ABP0UP02_9BRYO
MVSRWQPHCVVVSSASSSCAWLGASACCKSSEWHFSGVVAQATLKPNRLRLKQQHHLWTCFSSSHATVRSYTMRPCASATSTNFDQNTQNGGEMQQDAAVSGLSFEMLKPVQSFPWHRVSRRLADRLVQSLWTVGKWIMIPVLLLSVLNEVSYTLMQEKLLLIPISMIGGIMFVGILNEVFADISGDVEKIKFPWHLFAIGIVFVLVKGVAPSFPRWAQFILPHFANGGLWQVIWLANLWKKQNDSKQTAE